ncbi:two-component system response regulator protein [Flavobacteriales bacterium ALC-1]|nr:two-component system response regulator protein [Flavobacteriales bacterium ALC-1]
MIKCLILEDELSAIELLKSYIEKTPFLECIGSFESGLDIPIALLQKSDILFLDIQLPELDGLSFLKTIVNPPIVVVTSAFPNYALNAFEEAVTDYLLKPFSYERFYKATSRIRDSISEKSTQNQIFLYANKTLYKTNIDDILFLKAEVDYVNVFSTQKKILVTDSLHNLIEKISDVNIIRVHRSYAVNFMLIDKIQGNQIFIKEHTIPIGRTFKDNLLNKINP